MNSKAGIPFQNLTLVVLLSTTQKNQTVLKNTKKLPCHTFETALKKNMLAYESCDQMSLNNEKTVSKISVNFLNVPFEKSHDPECKQKLFRTPPFLCLSCTVRILIYYFQCGPPLHIQHIPL